MKNLVERYNEVDPEVHRQTQINLEGILPYTKQITPDSIVIILPFLCVYGAKLDLNESKGRFP